MGRMKPQTNHLPEERLMHTKDGGAYDVALTTLFAKSVSRIRM